MAERFHVYPGPRTPFPREGDLASEDIRDQVPIACKWQTWNQDPAFLSLRTETFLPHPAIFLVNSCASLAPSTCNMSNTHLLSTYFMPGLSYRWDIGPGGPTGTELTGGGGGVWGVRGAGAGGAISDLFGRPESCGRMEMEVFAHKPTQKPGHCSEGNINSLGGSWKFNSGKTEHMLLISWLPWLTIAWQSEEATKNNCP